MMARSTRPGGRLHEGHRRRRLGPAKRGAPTHLENRDINALALAASAPPRALTR
ncbi:MAG TPA: hypothetical protein VG319_01300 [Polyangia bacterium]|jgi:hypothetical protein|nr:hypothetical protein [Polyangia bacterium]